MAFMGEPRAGSDVATVLTEKRFLGLVVPAAPDATVLAGMSGAGGGGGASGGAFEGDGASAGSGLLSVVLCADGSADDTGVAFWSGSDLTLKRPTFLLPVATPSGAAAGAAAMVAAAKWM